MRIGYHDYTLRFVDSVDSIDTDYIARAYFHTGKIEIMRNLPPQEFLTALLHETMHIIETQHKLNLSEQVISSLASSLSQVIRDNFDLFSYLVNLIHSNPFIKLGGEHEARIHDLAQGTRTEN